MLNATLILSHCASIFSFIKRTCLLGTQLSVWLIGLIILPLPPPDTIPIMGLRIEARDRCVDNVREEIKYFKALLRNIYASLHSHATRIRCASIASSFNCWNYPLRSFSGPALGVSKIKSIVEAVRLFDFVSLLIVLSVLILSTRSSMYISMFEVKTYDKIAKVLSLFMLCDWAERYHRNNLQANITLQPSALASTSVSACFSVPGSSHT